MALVSTGSSLLAVLEQWIDVAVAQIERGTATRPLGSFWVIWGPPDPLRQRTVGPARAHMLDRDYHLEILGLESLWGLRNSEQTGILRDFQRTRTDLVTVLTPVLRSPALLAQMLTLKVNCRTALVSSKPPWTRCQGSHSSQGVMLASGLLPM